MTKATLIKKKKEDLVELLLMSENKRKIIEKVADERAISLKDAVEKLNASNNIIKVLLFVELVTLLIAVL